MTVEKVSEGDRSIRSNSWKKYQRATEVSEGDRSIRGRQLKEISEGDRSISAVIRSIRDTGDSWKNIRGRQKCQRGWREKYQMATVDRNIRGLQKYLKVTEVSDTGDSWKSIRGRKKYQRATVEKNIRGRQKYQRVTEVIRGRQLKEISEGDRSIRGWQKYQRATVEWNIRGREKYQRATEVSEGDRSFRVQQLKKYQKYQSPTVEKVSEGDRSIRGRQLKNIRGVRGGGGGGTWASNGECAVDKIWLNYKILATVKKISEGESWKSIRGRQKYQSASVEKLSEGDGSIRGRQKYQREKEVSVGDRSIRGRQKYQRATEVSEGYRSIRGRQKYQRATKVSEGDRSIRGRQLKNIRGRKGGGRVREPQRAIAQLIKYDWTIRYWRQLKKYQRVTEVSEGDRSI